MPAHTGMAACRSSLLSIAVLGVPVGVLYPLFGLLLFPMIAAAAMSFRKSKRAKYYAAERAFGGQVRRVWLNLELAKKPPQCLEYIVVHELVHLLERHHNERFTARMVGFMPQWRQYRDMLNKSPLGHEEWAY